MNEFFGTDVDLTYCNITAWKTEAKKENYIIKTSCTSIGDVHNSKSNKLNKKKKKTEITNNIYKLIINIMKFIISFLNSKERSNQYQK